MEKKNKEKNTHKMLILCNMEMKCCAGNGNGRVICVTSTSYTQCFDLVFSFFVDWHKMLCLNCFVALSTYLFDWRMQLQLAHRFVFFVFSRKYKKTRHLHKYREIKT